MSEYLKQWIEALMILGLIIGATMGAVYFIVNLEHKPPCTAYQAIDGKPVCIEYQLTKVE
jgi:hypothetical protein